MITKKAIEGARTLIERALRESEARAIDELPKGSIYSREAHEVSRRYEKYRRDAIVRLNKTARLRKNLSSIRVVRRVTKISTEQNTEIWDQYDKYFLLFETGLVLGDKIVGSIYGSGFLTLPDVDARKKIGRCMGLSLTASTIAGESSSFENPLLWKFLDNSDKAWDGLVSEVRTKVKESVERGPSIVEKFVRKEKDEMRSKLVSLIRNDIDKIPPESILLTDMGFWMKIFQLSWDEANFVSSVIQRTNFSSVSLDETEESIGRLIKEAEVYSVLKT